MCIKCCYIMMRRNFRHQNKFMECTGHMIFLRESLFDRCTFVSSAIGDLQYWTTGIGFDFNPSL